MDSMDTNLNEKKKVLNKKQNKYKGSLKADVMVSSNTS